MVSISTFYKFLENERSVNYANLAYNVLYIKDVQVTKKRNHFQPYVVSSFTVVR